MQKLAKGIHSFRSGYFATHRQLFEQLATAGQKPETLFITCSDSRVVPNLITNAAPGELFLVRNVGNVVPHPSLPGGTAAAMEYAVEVLEVENVIVCGHTQCGAIQAILHPETVEHLPYVKRWVDGGGELSRLLSARPAPLGGGAPAAVYTEDNGARTFDYPRQPAGQVNYMITIGADGKMSALRQVLTPENFARVRPGMGGEDVRRMLGKPARQVPYELKREIVWSWKFLEPPSDKKAFNVVFSPDYRVLRTEVDADPDGPDMRGGG